jgi:SAM-dependent methyltransferase
LRREPAVHSLSPKVWGVRRWIGTALRRGFRVRLRGRTLLLVLETPPARERNRSEKSLAERHLRHLADQYPDLHRLLAGDFGQPYETLEAANAYVAVIDGRAREAQLRNALVALHSTASTDRRRREIELDLARSNFRSGVVDRAVLLLREEPADPLCAAVRDQIAEFERFYQSLVPVVGNDQLSPSLGGDVRGRSLIPLFERDRDQLVGAVILHVAPEAELSAWFRAHALALRLNYVTLDPYSAAADLRDDLTALSLEEGSVDVIVCHRVLEHILDEASALSEMFRVLKPGGLLQLSVPISPNLAVTNEWIVPDASHHDHVRQYGRDVEDRVASYGFEVTIDELLLRRSLDEHLRHRTFPLRVLTCRKVG